MRISGLSLINYLKGSYEAETTLFYEKHIEPGWTIIDIGADVGYFSVIFSRLVSSTGLVYALEPYSWRYFNYLLANIKQNNADNVIPMMLGVSDRIVSKDFYFDCRSTYNIGKNQKRGSIRCLPLDNLFDHSKIDLIKMDIEGSELEALRGMEKVLSNNRDIKLVIECNPQLYDKISIDIQEMFDLLARHNFHFYEILNDGSIKKRSDAEIISIARKNKYINFYCSR